ncbi:MAG: hypothetical protein MJ184_03445 [Treponema sp.]|uniref:hypothetical protein n=1 Tax=Treponema sp. TaxID=166 RepID=UPI00298D9EEF|nr:hypothetical protein [Treponema sp.]MCQ2600393.1 hypothetical protein [Treponema sp.]
MAEQEFDEEIEKLNMQKKGLEGNRSLCAVVIVLVVFMTVKDNGLKTTPWYILAILALVILAALYILITDSVKIKELKNKISNLNLNNEDSEQNKN